MKEKKMEMFQTMYELEALAATTTFNGRNYFEQSEGFYKALTALGWGKEYIKWSHEK